MLTWPQTEAPVKRPRAALVKRLLFLTIPVALIYFLTFVAAIHYTGTIDSSAASDVIIVLGAGLLRDGRPGWALTRRSLHAAELWQQEIAPYVLCSGGHAENFPRSEAAACREVLLANGLPASAIVLEEESRSTEENALFSRRIIDSMRFADVVLVSDSYHMLRASWLFDMQGISATSSPVPSARIPSRLSYIQSLVREFLAYHWQVFKVVFQIPFTHVGGL